MGGADRWSTTMMGFPVLRRASINLVVKENFGVSTSARSRLSTTRSIGRNLFLLSDPTKKKVNFSVRQTRGVRARWSPAGLAWILSVPSPRVFVTDCALFPTVPSRMFEQYEAEKRPTTSLLPEGSRRPRSGSSSWTLVGGTTVVPMRASPNVPSSAASDTRARDRHGGGRLRLGESGHRSVMVKDFCLIDLSMADDWGEEHYDKIVRHLQDLSPRVHHLPGPLRLRVRPEPRGPAW